MRKNAAAWIGLAAALALGSGQALLRSQDAPPVEELVPWQPYESLGEPPHDRKILLDFAADWCAPCRRMQMTTFRDPRFVEWLEARGLRPVRFEETSGNWSEFQAARARYGINGLPALVVLREDGKPSTPIVGLRTRDDLLWALRRALEDLQTDLRWHQPGFRGSGDPARITVLNFGRSYLLGREDRDDWRTFPSEEFRDWADRHLDLVSDPGHPVRGRSYYRQHGIHSVPTIILLGPDGEEIGRFEGAAAIAVSPGAIARIAREAGLRIPDPPEPFSIAGRSR